MKFMRKPKYFIEPRRSEGREGKKERIQLFGNYGLTAGAGRPGRAAIRTTSAVPGLPAPAVIKTIVALPHFLATPDADSVSTTCPRGYGCAVLVALGEFPP